jgi:hypothetical protein
MAPTRFQLQWLSFLIHFVEWMARCVCHFEQWQGHFRRCAKAGREPAGPLQKQRAGEGRQRHFHWFFNGLKQTCEKTMFSRKSFLEKHKGVFSLIFSGFKRRTEPIGHWRLRASTRQKKHISFDSMQKMTFERITFKNAGPDLDREV